MTWLKITLAAGASLLAMTAHASAEPISLILAVSLYAGPLGSVFGFTAIAGAIQVGFAALAVGASFAVQALTKKSDTQNVDPGAFKNTFENSETSELNAIGRVRIGGLKAFGNTTGADRYRVIWHCRGPLVAIETHYLGGREVTVEANGDVSSPPFVDATRSWVNIQSKVGSGAETVWTDVNAAFPTLWTADHLGKGIFQSRIKYTSPGNYTERFGQMYTGGEPPLEVIARVNTAYDPRDTAQDRYNSATWEWTTNGVLCAAGIMLQYPDLTIDSFDWDFIGDEADRADVLVATLAGTEARSRCSGIWLSEARRGETMQQVLDSIGAEIITTEDGLIRIRLIDDVPTSEITIPAERAQTQLTWRSGPEAVERPNVCVVKYYSPELNYEMGEIDMTGIAWARIDAEVARYGEKQMTIELPFCPSASQAQRIARRQFATARADIGSVRTNMFGLLVWGMTYASIEDEDGGDTMLCKISAARIDDEAGEVEIPFTVWPTLTEWNPAVDEAAAPDQVPEVLYESALETPTAPGLATVVIHPDASYETRIRYTPATGATSDEAVYRTYTGGEPDAYSGMTEYRGDFFGYGYEGIYTVGMKMDFKHRGYDADGNASYYSAVLSVDPMAVNNTVCAAPTVTGATGGSSFDATLEVAELHASYVLVEERHQSSGAWTGWNAAQVVNVRPEQPVAIGFSFTDPLAGDVEVRVATRTSGGVVGPYWTFSYSHVHIP